MSKKKKRTPAISEASTAEHMTHLPNKLHLQACIDGARVQRNKKKYTRKGKSRFDYRKDDSWTGFHFMIMHIFDNCYK